MNKILQLKIFFKNLKISKSNIIGILLGVAAGIGHATSLRIFSFVGFSEILFLVIALYLFYKSPYFFLKQNNIFEFVTRSYLLFSTFFILPFITIIVNFFSISSIASEPIFILNFIFGFSLMFLIVNSIKLNLINFELATLVFAAIFMGMNIYALVFDISVYHGKSRYSGFAVNPNQLIIYIVSLILLIVAFNRKLLLFCLPFLFYLGIKSRSDTFLVIAIAMICIFVFLSLFNHNKLSFLNRIIIMLIFFTIFSSLVFFIYIESIINFFSSADIQFGRVTLMYNAFLVTLQSPFVGWGAGTFSGNLHLFEGIEAHNNFLDFSMQFGFIVPAILHFIIIASFFKSIRCRDHIFASVIVAFLVSGLFNFFGRHFIFWVVSGILFEYWFRKSDNINLMFKQK